MDEVGSTGREIIITKRGKPVAKLVPYRETKRVQSIAGAMIGMGEILGDIVSPTPEYWGEWPSPSDPLVLQGSDSLVLRAAVGISPKSRKSARKHVAA